MQIELIFGFGELRRGHDDFEEAKKWKAIEERDMQEEDQLPAIQEENGNDTGAVFSGKEESGGDQNSNPIQQETNDENLGNVESGGGAR